MRLFFPLYFVTLSEALLCGSVCFYFLHNFREFARVRVSQHKRWAGDGILGTVQFLVMTQRV